MTLQEETLRKGKSVHPTLQNTESHCRLQQLFLHIKTLSSGSLEAVKLGGRGEKGKKNTMSRLVQFWAQFYCPGSQCLREQRLFAAETPRLWKVIPTPWFHPLQQCRPPAKALATSFVSKLEKRCSGCRKRESACFVTEEGFKLNHIHIPRHIHTDLWNSLGKRCSRTSDSLKAMKCKSCLLPFLLPAENSRPDPKSHLKSSLWFLFGLDLSLCTHRYEGKKKEGKGKKIKN